MSTETTSTPNPETGTPSKTSVTPAARTANLMDRSREALKVYGREIAAYLRELPRLLEEGEAGQYALINGDEILSIWETWGDACQAGYQRFGPNAPICVMKIDPRDPERYAQVFAQLKAEKDSSCPP